MNEYGSLKGNFSKSLLLISVINFGLLLEIVHAFDIGVHCDLHVSSFLS